MADPVHSSPPGDDVLTAYIDGELDADARRTVEAALAADPATRARLDALKASARPFKDAFHLVTEAAPHDRLSSMLATVAPRAELGAPRRVWMSAAAVVLFASGVAIGTSNSIVPRSAPFATQVAESESAKLAAPRAAPPSSVQTDALQRQAGRLASQGTPAPSAPAEVAAPKPAPAPEQGAQVLADAAPAAGAGAVGAASSSGLIAPAPPPTARSFAAPAAPLAPSAGGPASVAPGPLAQAPVIATAPPVPPATSAAAAPGGNAATWRQVVADYIALKTAETVSLMPENPRLYDAVRAYGGKLQLDLGGKLGVAMASLRDVRLYDYRGRPLVEASYLSDDGATVVTFCIILNMQADAPIGIEMRNGQNIVYWAAGGHGFMVAGKQPPEALEAIARDLAARFI